MTAAAIERVARAILAVGDVLRFEQNAAISSTHGSIFVREPKDKPGLLQFREADAHVFHSVTARYRFAVTQLPVLLSKIHNPIMALTRDPCILRPMLVQRDK
jgi:hypothetical protein